MKRKTDNDFKKPYAYVEATKDGEYPPGHFRHKGDIFPIYTSKHQSKIWMKKSSKEAFREQQGYEEPKKEEAPKDTGGDGDQDS